MSLPQFEVLQPATLGEALKILSEVKGAEPIAGGTNLIVDMRAGTHRPRVVVDVAALHDLPLIRNRATVGGNLVTAAPCSDTAPALLTLDAEVKLASVRGTRRVPLEKFLVNAFSTVRRLDELLISVRFPIPSATATGAFRKMGLRKISCMAKVDVAVMLDADATGRCTSARIALAAASPVAVRARAAEATLVGKVLTPEAIATAASLTAKAAVPRAGSEYKLSVVQGLARRLLAEAALGLERGGANA
ncbi:MAG: FAD binding domain-containing protein [Candidatus Bipolaricaulota bacterium]|nr:FAD binding domain-containing protein [Candidatus Bipolaricaulota bacterium]